MDQHMCQTDCHKSIDHASTSTNTSSSWKRCACHAAGEAVREYINATVPTMAFGEYWDTCEYTDGVLNYNQDSHRQRTVNWCDKTGGTAAAFDFTTKGAACSLSWSHHITSHLISHLLGHANLGLDPLVLRSSFVSVLLSIWMPCAQARTIFPYSLCLL